MNDSYNSNNTSHENVGYGIAVSIVILIIIIFIAVISYICNRMHMHEDPSFHLHHHLPRTDTSPHSDDNQQDSIDIELGIRGNREASGSKIITDDYEKLKYPRAGAHKGDTTRSCCSICLADYKETDVLKVLPDCHHLFHAKCVEPWLRLNPSCPICRNSPVPKPFSTPLAETMPFAARHDYSYR